MNKQEIAGMIDHTLLSPTATEKQIEKLCQEAKQYSFASVCVNPVWVPFASYLLKDSSVKICTVIGFPLGATSSMSKNFEAQKAVQDGADEIDMVIDIGACMSGRFSAVGTDIKTVVEGAKEKGKKLSKNIIVKVILETCYLDENAIKTCCLLAQKAGADFVKTSTGFAILKDENGELLPNGANVRNVKLMSKTVGTSMGVKASGGIRDAKTAKEMIKAGADRIGTSSGVKIIEEWDD